MLENFAAINEDKLKHERIGLDKAEECITYALVLLFLLIIFFNASLMAQQ